MSGGIDTLQLKEEDVVKFLAAGVHLGGSNADFQMEKYIYKRKPDGNYIINLKKTWEKLLLAARIIVTIEHPGDVCVISARPYGQRAILKFASHTGATAVAGRFTPGTFTNQIQAAFREPRLLVVCDPRTDQQAITEASYVNIPVIAFCNTDSPLRHVDVSIPCNNKGPHAVGLMWWLLSREVLRIRGSISRQIPWDVMPDLYFYRDPEEAEKEEQATATAHTEEPAYTGTEWGGGDRAAATTDATDWNVGGVTTTQDWGAETVAPSTGTTAPTTTTTTEWGAPTPETKEWGAPTPETKEWGAEATPTPTPTPTKEWGAEENTVQQPPASEWGTSVTTKDSTTGGAEWA